MLGPNILTYSARSFQAKIWRLLSGEFNKPKRSLKGTDTMTSQMNLPDHPTVELTVDKNPPQALNYHICFQVPSS